MIEKKNMRKFVEDNFVDYAIHTIEDMAIPAVEDGLKISQRHIIYSMFKNKMRSKDKFTKCSNIVGKTMAEFSPTGDSSIYGALTRMSQDWILPYPLVETQGNNGHRDGERPAAMRYLSGKLSKYADYMVEDLDKETVPFIETFDGESKEPLLLTSKLPNILINPQKGIAVSLACNFLPHNLAEVMREAIYSIHNSDYKSKLIPDFPTGGIILDEGDVVNHRVRVRGEYVIKGQKIIFTSVPYRVSKTDVICKIDKLIESGELTEVIDAFDNSKNDDVELEIIIADGTNPTNVVPKLFGLTNLQVSFSYNHIALKDGKPKMFTKTELVKEYVSYQRNILLNKCRFEIKRIKSRLNILDGMLIALENIDEIIALIKTAEDKSEAKSKLIDKYNFNELQAEAILKITLSRLTKLDKVKILEEKKSLTEELTKWEDIFDVKENADNELIKMFKQIASISKERQTKIKTISEGERIKSAVVVYIDTTGRMKITDKRVKDALLSCDFAEKVEVKFKIKGDGNKTHIQTVSVAMLTNRWKKMIKKDNINIVSMRGVNE